VLNRFPHEIETVLETRVNGRSLRLPTIGKLRLPAQTSLLLPIDYELRPGLTIAQSTLQLLGHRTRGRELKLELYSPGGGELVLALPGRVTSAHAGSRPVVVQQARHGGQVSARLVLGPGEHELLVRWR